MKAVRGLQWTQAAMGNATWTGPRLRDVLLDAGLQIPQDQIDDWYCLFFLNQLLGLLFILLFIIEQANSV